MNGNNQLEECSICDTAMGGKARSAIKCLYCNFEACSKCYKAFLLTKSSAQCMSCQKIWNTEFLQTHFTKSWVYTTYAVHLKDIMFEREQSMLPAALERIERDRRQVEYDNRIRRLAQIEYWINHYEYNIRQHERKIQNAQSKLDQFTDKKYEKEYNYLLDTILHLIHQTDDSHAKLKPLLEEQATILKQNEEDAEYVTKKGPKKITYHRACPVTDCKGFLNSHWRCGLCGADVCKDCREILPKKEKKKEEKEVDEHKCDPDVVATMELLDKDTKPCPKCKVPIFKIEGCNQMYCVECHTAWDWKTGQIETGRIHNPHYYEMLRKQSPDGTIRREPGDIPGCNALNNVDEHMLRNVFGHLLKEDRNHLTRAIISITFNDQVFRIGYQELHKYLLDTFTFLIHIVQIKTHIQEVEIARNYRTINLVENNMDLRIKYLLNQLTKKAWQVNLLKRWKKEEYKIEIRQLLEALCQIFNDILRGMIDKVQNKEEITVFYLEDIKVQILTWIRYFNTNSSKISERFNYFTKIMINDYIRVMTNSRSLPTEFYIENNKRDVDKMWKDVKNKNTI